MRAYLTIYDRANNQIGFIGEVDPGELAEKSPISKTTKIIIIAVVVPSALLLLLVIFCVMMKCRGKT